MGMVKVQPQVRTLARFRRRPAWGLWLFLIPFLAYFAFPLYWLLVSVTKDTSQLYTTLGVWFAAPSHLGTNLHEVLTYQNGIFPRWFMNSLLYAFVVSAVSTLTSAMAGYAFAKGRFPGREAYFRVVLGTIMVPQTALTLPVFLLMQHTGLLNTVWAVILPQVVNPLGLYLMRLFWTDSFPDELIEAARLDGASDSRIFWSLGLPLVRAGLTTVALFAFVGAWNNFFLPLVVLSRDDLYPLTLGLSVWNATASAGLRPINHLVLLGSLISVLPLMLAFFTLGRYWQSGLTVGATKG